MKGKKTYGFIGTAIAAVGIGVLSRHGLDLGPIAPDIAAGVTAALLVGAAWARSVVGKGTVAVTDTRGKPSAGPKF